MLFSNDGSWKPMKVAIDPAQSGIDWTHATKRRVIFIRHGESEWNKVFNRTKNPIKILQYLVVACVKELLQLFSLNSRFYDSPLSDTGLQDCEDLKDLLCQDPSKDDSTDLKIMRGDADATPSSVVS